ncbi:hypothetical protein L596_009767 [Steinernema carpocapsae]|uniref:Uncharacterized protein n=1 Tax=Steinernema carpocapsae TaxID=34508 RepID=A0A4U5PGU1_STECR|nr:hypothetical protein L596_009767 [Steinernema carpocapsae]
MPTRQRVSPRPGKVQRRPTPAQRTSRPAQSTVSQVSTPSAPSAPFEEEIHDDFTYSGLYPNANNYM